MTDEEFMNLAEKLGEYIQTDKVFFKNPARCADVERAVEIAEKLFKEAKITIKDDPIQMGALIVHIEDFDIVVRGQEEIELFKELISKASNFELYPTNDETVKFSLLFNEALKRIR